MANDKELEDLLTSLPDDELEKVFGKLNDDQLNTIFDALDIPKSPEGVG